MFSSFTKFQYLNITAFWLVLTTFLQKFVWRWK